jgi:drug/metabolite transporter (DMT)-like permease
MSAVPTLALNTDRFNYGYPAVFITLLVWSGFFLSLRAGANSAMTMVDLSILRFVLPALCFSTVVYKSRKKIQKVPIKYLLGIITGSGFPFFYLGATGMQYASVSYGSLLIPGTLPLFVSAIAVTLFSEPFSTHRKIGLFSIGVGIAIMISTSLIDFDYLQLKGVVLFLFGSAMWAMFTICMRMSGLNAIEGAGITAIGSLLLLGGYCIIMPFEINMFTVSSSELLIQFLIQGVCVGLIAGFCYGFAISRLGAEMTAAFGSLTPVVASLLAIPLFAEMLTSTTIIGIIFICGGSLLASQIFKKSH